MYVVDNDPIKQEFLEQIMDKLVDFLPDDIHEDATVAIEDVIKNNDQHLMGLVIKEPNINTTPTIYLDHMLEEYRDGRGIESILNQISNIYVAHRLDIEEQFDISQITNFENAKSMLTTKIVNTDLNKEFLKDTPHKEFGDLSVFCQIKLADFNDSMASITVKEGISKQWNVSFDEMYSVASLNDLNNSGPKLIPLESVMSEMMYGVKVEQDSFLPEDFETPNLPMFVLSTADNTNGAKLINQPELMEQIADFFGGDFIVLPSSIHETIIIPADRTNGWDINELGQMVKDVNGSEVKPDEILSDHPYIFDKEQRVLTYEKDGEKITMQFTKETKVDKEPEKKGVKARLEEGIKKSKEAASKQDNTKHKTKESELS